MELKNSRLTPLGKDGRGRNRFALDCSLGAIQMREPGGLWQDIVPLLTQAPDGSIVASGVPYAFKIGADGSREIYPDRMDMGKRLKLPKVPFLAGLKPVLGTDNLRLEGPRYDVILGIENTRATFQVLIKKSIPFDRITLDVDSLGLDIPSLLTATEGVGIPRPYLIDAEGTVRLLKWDPKDGQLELGFDLTGLKFPILLRNTTIDVQIGASANDGSRYGGSSFTTGSLTIPFGKISTSSCRNFTRFTGITIDAGATIDVAYLTYTAYQNDTSTTVNSDITGNDTATPTAPTDYSSYDATVSTTALVEWDGVGSWTANAEYNTPSLVAILQELADSYAPYAAGAMQFLHKDNGSSTGASRWPYDYGASAAKSTKLHIEWSVAGPILDAYNKLLYTSEPPTPNAWNQLKQEAGTGWKKILYV